MITEELEHQQRSSFSLEKEQFEEKNELSDELLDDFQFTECSPRSSNECRHCDAVFCSPECAALHIQRCACASTLIPSNDFDMVSHETCPKRNCGKCQRTSCSSCSLWCFECKQTFHRVCSPNGTKRPSPSDSDDSDDEVWNCGECKIPIQHTTKPYHLYDNSLNALIVYLESLRKQHGGDLRVMDRFFRKPFFEQTFKILDGHLMITCLVHF